MTTFAAPNPSLLADVAMADLDLFPMSRWERVKMFAIDSKTFVMTKFTTMKKKVTRFIDRHPLLSQALAGAAIMFYYMFLAFFFSFVFTIGLILALEAWFPDPA